MSTSIRPAGRTCITIVGLICSVAAIIISATLLTGCGSSAASHGNAPASRSSSVVTEVQSVTAKGIVATIGGKNFVQRDVTANLWGMTDAGWFYIGGTKYAINVFTDHESLVRWIEIAKKMGMVPKWETATSVAYKSMLPQGSSQKLHTV